jgi:hypothetical protein
MTAGISTRLVVALWIGSGVILLAALGRPQITRSQEARVLETARQMLGNGWRAWLLPTLNGEPRLKKPPLSYVLDDGRRVQSSVRQRRRRARSHGDPGLADSGSALPPGPRAL